ncbi:MAG: sodium:proton antiporter [Rhodobacteraceae bacterium]|nr:sodium:proton antiporter [Paracoccaceae bacterium]
MTAATFLNLSAAVFGFAALFGYLNERYLRLPLTIGLMVIALATSVAILIAEALFNFGAAESARGWLRQIDFHASLMIGMLSFLLFAGALHTDLSALLRQRRAVLLMATMGVALSTVVVGLLTYGLSTALGLGISFEWCLVFGALISPTDPVAVLSILRRVAVPKPLQATIAGESLFNDGVGVVLFLALLEIAVGSHGAGAHGGEGATAASIGMLFVKEIGLGIALGLAGGGLAYTALRRLDQYVVEVIITLALVLGVYAIATTLHASGPLAVVIAGLIIGNQGAAHAMSEATRQHVTNFWELIDEILNAALFLLIGFEVLIIGFGLGTITAALAAIPIALIGRMVAVSGPATALRALGDRLQPGAAPILIWGGLRGGISVALALSLPEFEGRDTVLAMTYAVVVFSIVVQGLTMQRVATRALAANEDAAKTV